MKLLVTGGLGFLGSHVVDAALACGHSVSVFDLGASRVLPDNVRLIRGDLLDQELVSRAVEGADAVIHLAGFADLNAAKTRPLESAKANVIGTLHVLEAMRAHAVSRLLFASTAYVYSREGGFYRCSKQACESYIEEYGKSFGLRYTILRYGSLYGPRADASNGVYRLLRAAIAEGRIHYSGDAEDVREYIHVEDASRLTIDVLDSRYEGQHIMLTGQAPTRARDLFKMFEEILGREIGVEYAATKAGHYAVTPYAYTPRPSKKLVTTEFVDMGQGLLRMIEEIHHELED